MIILLSFLIIQFNDTITKDLMDYVQRKYNSDTTFIFQKLTTFPILKGSSYYWNYYPYDYYRNENIIFKLKESYIIGIRFTFYENEKIFYLYQAEKYERNSSSWILKRKTRILVNSLDCLEILFYDDKEISD